MQFLHSEIAFLRELKRHDLDAMTERENSITATITRFYDEKFRTLDEQIRQTAIALKSAVDAAFAAANTAAQEQEIAFTKQIDQLHQRSACLQGERRQAR